MDFTNKNLRPLFRLGENEIYITSTIKSTWIIMGVLIILAIIARTKIKKFQDKPASNSLQNVLELLVETMMNFTESNLGKSLSGLGGYFFGIFVFILASNYAGLFGLRPPTADLATTFALSLNTFVLIHFLGAVRRKGHYLKEYLHPNPIFLPMNIIGEAARPVSLAFRMFGNILGGVIILGMIYKALPVILRFLVPDVLHFYFDIFAGSLQAFIFTVLSMTFIREKADPEV